MKKILIVVTVALALSVPQVDAATTTVDVSDNEFSPSKVRARVGGAVHWTTAGTQGGHNVREDHKIFYSGRETDLLDYRVRFSAGTFRYFCETHGTRTSGMNGLVRVPVTISATPSGLSFTVRWATSSTKTGAKFDIQYKIGKASWRSWMTDTSRLRGVFGKDGAPAVAEAGKRYRFRARSQKRDHHSRWSPVESFTP